jgi:hypothetical protein
LAEIKKGIKTLPKFITFFASTKYDLEIIGKGLETSFPGTTLIGCGTVGELITGHMLRDSIVAMTMNEQLVGQVVVEVIPYLSAANGVAKRFRLVRKEIGLQAIGLGHTEVCRPDPDRWIAFCGGKDHGWHWQPFRPHLDRRVRR